MTAFATRIDLAGSSLVLLAHETVVAIPDAQCTNEEAMTRTLDCKSHARVEATKL